MITKQDARAYVQAWLDRNERGLKLAIAREWDAPFGWVFGYNTVAHLRGEEMSLAGNAPLLIERSTGDVVRYGVHGSVEVQIAAHERRLQMCAAAFVLTITRALDLTAAATLRRRLDLSHDELAHFRRRDPLPIFAGSEHDTRAWANELAACGIAATVRSAAVAGSATAPVLISAPREDLRTIPRPVRFGNVREAIGSL
jgi:hypothetical protein